MNKLQIFKEQAVQVLLQCAAPELDPGVRAGFLKSLSITALITELHPDLKGQSPSLYRSLEYLTHPRGNWGKRKHL